MERLPEETQWFAVRVKSRHEKKVSATLEYKGLESLLPLYLARNTWSDRTQKVELPLFPGYVFCKTDRLNRVPILSTPGVIDVVRFGRDPAAVNPEEIAALQRLVSSGLLAQPWPRLEVGQPVEIDEGPLAGISGVVIEVKKRPRLVLSVTLLCRAVLVELDQSWVKAPRSHPLSARFFSTSHSQVQ
jgi:transcription antitermination factor NusG